MESGQGLCPQPQGPIEPDRASRSPGSPSWTAQGDLASFPNFAIPRQGLKPGELVFCSLLCGNGFFTRKAREEDPGFGLLVCLYSGSQEPAGRARSLTLQSSLAQQGTWLAVVDSAP
jgi:hypothetical protein